MTEGGTNEKIVVRNVWRRVASRASPARNAVQEILTTMMTTNVL
jgi:hypothetical protein